MEQLITEEQALQVALALVSGEKVVADFGHAVLAESKEILDKKLFLVQEENKIEKKPRPDWFIKGPATPRVYDEYYPKLYGGISMKKKEKDNG